MQSQEKFEQSNNNETVTYKNLHIPEIFLYLYIYIFFFVDLLVTGDFIRTR